MSVSLSCFVSATKYFQVIEADQNFALLENISNCCIFTVLLNIVVSGKWCGNPSEIMTKMSGYV